MTMFIVLLASLTILISYLVGAIPFGYVVARCRGVDILREGSGNIGATNVARVLGKKFGIMVFLFDFAKGALPVLAAGVTARGEPKLVESLGSDGLPMLAGLAAFLGHLFPIYLRFRGGKGVATAAGVVTVLLPMPALGSLVVWIAVVSASRYVSLASLSAALALCYFRLVLTPPVAAEGRALTLFCFVTAALVFVRHRSNIVRLYRGTENRIQGGPALFRSKTVHVLALGTWFGSMFFFTFVVAFSLFHTFGEIGAKPPEERPLWLPAPLEFARSEQTLRDQGSRVAGAAVGPIFRWYFLLQAICGVLAVVPALSWSRSEPDKVHRARSAVLLAALLGVAAGWWMDKIVHDLKDQRNQSADAVLRSSSPISGDLLQAANEARAEFGRWHGFSVIVNLLTFVFVAVGMGLAAHLPAEKEGVRMEEKGMIRK